MTSPVSRSVRISVVIPVFNGAETIRETLDSVLAQTWQDWEIIVVNDGSTDDTLAVLAQYQQQHPDLGDRFRVLSFENAGVSTSRNRGIAAAQAEYIAFLDADDLWTPEKLAGQWQALQDTPTATVAYSFTAWIDETGSPLPNKFTNHCDGAVHEALLFQDFVASGSNPLIHKSALEVVGEFDPELHHAEDWDLWLRLAHQFYFVCVPEIQILYRKRSVSASSNVQLMARQSLKIIRRELDHPHLTLPDGSRNKVFRNKVLGNRYQYLMFKSIERPLNRPKGWMCLGFLLQVLRYDRRFLKRRKTLAIIVAKILVALVWPPLGDRR